MLLIFNSRFRSIKFSFLILLLLSFTLQIFGPLDMEGLIMGGSNDPHLDKLIMLTCQGLNEGIQCRHLLSRGCELPRTECRDKHRIISSKFGEYGEDELIILLLHFALLQ